ncbi:MAG: ribosome assembly RNA-binding protein YhbY [Clostridia bacterium]|nr:ribosome assembly RNA-binding protein YhbY [Clostridia bacterium]
MLTSKQRAYLRSLASTQPAIMQIGKGGIGESLVKTVDDALQARELIKLSVLETASDEAVSVAQELAGATGAEVVAVIGRKILLYRRSTRKQRIELP